MVGKHLEMANEKDPKLMLGCAILHKHTLTVERARFPLVTATFADIPHHRDSAWNNLLTIILVDIDNLYIQQTYLFLEGNNFSGVQGVHVLFLSRLLKSPIILVVLCFCHV